MLLHPVVFFLLLREIFSFDFPIPFDRPEVAFQPRKVSKYYNLIQREWLDGSEDFKVRFPTHDQIVSFCQTMYPDDDIVNARQGQLRSLSFCNFKDRDKCSDKQVLTWVCVSRSDQYTEAFTATPISTASGSIESFCYNETIHSIRLDTCTSVKIVWEHDLCSDYNLTMNKLINVTNCQIKETTDDDSSEVTIDGLLSADVLCCSKNKNRPDETSLGPDIVTLPGDIMKPFHPQFTVAPPTYPRRTELPQEWCNFAGVEDKEKNITDKNIKVMKDIYQYNTINDQGKDVTMEQISTVDKEMKQEVVVIYSEHFSCLASTLEILLKECRGLLEQYTARNLKKSQLYMEDINLASRTLKDVNETFKSICERHLNGEEGDLSSAYRFVVRQMQELKLQADELVTDLEELENCVECFPVHTTKPPYNPPDSKPTDEPDDNNDDGSNLQNQKYLIAIVSAVSCITILVALIFFILVVRRTLQKDRFTALPSADILTNEQYVTFLQKNGYANPTCRLPQKYLDDQD